MTVILVMDKSHFGMGHFGRKNRSFWPYIGGKKGLSLKAFENPPEILRRFFNDISPFFALFNQTRLHFNWLLVIVLIWNLRDFPSKRTIHWKSRGGRFPWKIKRSWGYPSHTVKFLKPFSSIFGVHNLILDIWPAPQVAEHWLQAAKSPQPGSDGASGSGGTPSGGTLVLDSKVTWKHF